MIHQVGAATGRADPEFFVSALRVLEDGDAIRWPGDVEIDADALWYKTHPDDWQQDCGGPSPQRGSASG